MAEAAVEELEAAFGETHHDENGNVLNPDVPRLMRAWCNEKVCSMG